MASVSEVEQLRWSAQSELHGIAQQLGDRVEEQTSSFQRELIERGGYRPYAFSNPLLRDDRPPFPIALVDGVDPDLYIALNSAYDCYLRGRDACGKAQADPKQALRWIGQAWEHIAYCNMCLGIAMAWSSAEDIRRALDKFRPKGRKPKAKTEYFRHLIKTYPALGNLEIAKLIEAEARKRSGDHFFTDSSGLIDRSTRKATDVKRLAQQISKARNGRR